MNLAAVGDMGLAPLDVIEGVELDEHVFVDVLGGQRVAWLVFTRHRITCSGGVDPGVCGCAPTGDADGYHVYQAPPGAPGAVPVTQALMPGGPA